MGKECIECGVWIESFESDYKRRLGRCDDCRREWQRLKSRKATARRRIKTQLLLEASPDEVLEVVGYYDAKVKE